MVVPAELDVSARHIQPTVRPGQTVTVQLNLDAYAGVDVRGLSIDVGNQSMVPEVTDARFEYQGRVIAMGIALQRNPSSNVVYFSIWPAIGDILVPQRTRELLTVVIRMAPTALPGDYTVGMSGMVLYRTSDGCEVAWTESTTSHQTFQVVQ